MPNHVATNLYVTGYEEDVKQFVDAACKGDGFDFENLFPMPKEIRNTSSPVVIQTEEEIKAVWDNWNSLPEDHVMKKICGDVPMGLGMTQKQHDENMALYGCTDWYQWANMNWGTKWGAYDCTPMLIDKHAWAAPGSPNLFSAHVSYNTAWSPAHKFFLKVSKDYSTLTFKHEYADEGGGFVGWKEIKNGKIIAEAKLDWESGEGKNLRIKLGHEDFVEEE